MEGLFEIEEETPSFESWCKNSFEQVDYRIGIPSYKRAETLKNKTLKSLKGIPPERIDVFVANEEEKAIYEKTLEKGTYSRIIVGVVGMRAIRNFMQNYYPVGTKLVSLDDDIDKIEKFVDEKTIVELDKINEFFCYAFKISEKLKTSYWGVYAVDNPYFMDNSIACGLRYLLGGFWGMVVNHDEETYVTLDDKEDFERSIRAYLYDGSVSRFDFISYKTNCYKEPGGMQVERTEDRVTWSGKKLMEMFPLQCKENTMRKNHFEVKLVEQRKDYRAQASKRIKLN